jgi:hypothetical protein
VWEVILLDDRMFKLSLADRLSLRFVLPKDGDLITVRVILELREEVFLASEKIESSRSFFRRECTMHNYRSLSIDVGLFDMFVFGSVSLRT